MPRLFTRLLFALCLSLALVVAGLVWWLQPASLLQAARLGTPPGGSSPYCSTWDFQNNTGQDVNDLHIRLAGAQSVSQVYTGTLNPFGLPDGTSGYDAVANAYKLNFSGALTVADSDLVRIGFCADSPLVRLDASVPPPFFWTINNTPVITAPVFTGLEWNWMSSTHLRIRIVNEQDVTKTLMALNVLDTDTALALEDLTPDIATGLPLALELAASPVDLGPHGDRFFDVFFDVASPPNHASFGGFKHAYVIQADLVDSSGDGNDAHLISQNLSPSPPFSGYLPVIRR